MTYEDAINIYTDGSCYSNPRRGGIGIRYITINETGDEEIEDDCLMGYKEATNKQMELLACTLGLKGAYDRKSINKINKVYIFTDSFYVRDNYMNAMSTWPNQKWLNQYGKPIAQFT